MSSDYRREIDGLRSVAIATVLTFHVRPDLMPSGFIGVDVFFVISGFLIGSILIKRSDTGGISFLEFYARRLLRVFPALAVAIFATLVFGAFYLTPSELADLTHSAAFAAVGASNFFFWKTTNYFASSSEFKPLLTTWSLGVEEQFYLIAPALIVFSTRLKRSMLPVIIAALCIGSFAASLYLTSRAPSSAYYLLPSRWFELGTGLLLASIWQAGWVVRLRTSKGSANTLFASGIVAIVCSAFWIDRAFGFPAPAALLPVIGTALVILAPHSSWSAATLGSVPAVAIGQLSYSIYLWHWPVLSFARIGAGGEISDGAVLGLLVLVLGLSYLSWRYVEQPFRSIRVSAPRAVVGAAGAAMALGMLCLATGPAIRGLAPAPEKIAVLDREADRLHQDRCLLSGGVLSTPGPDCIEVERPGIALIGDSHAATIAPVLRVASIEAGLAFTQLTRSECPPLVSTSRAILSWPMNASECARHNARTFDLLRNAPRVETVVLSAFWSAPFLNHERDKAGSYVDQDDRAGAGADPDLLRAGLQKTVQALHAMGKRVIVVGDVPSFRFNPLIVERSQQFPLRRWISQALSRSRIDGGVSDPRDTEPGPWIANAILRQISADMPHAALIDAERALCDASSCRFAQHGEVFYTDSHHVSDRGAEAFIAPARSLITARPPGAVLTGR